MVAVDLTHGAVLTGPLRGRKVDPDAVAAFKQQNPSTAVMLAEVGGVLTRQSWVLRLIAYCTACFETLISLKFHSISQDLKLSFLGVLPQ